MTSCCVNYFLQSSQTNHRRPTDDMWRRTHGRENTSYSKNPITLPILPVGKCFYCALKIELIRLRCWLFIRNLISFRTHTEKQCLCRLAASRLLILLVFADCVLALKESLDKATWLKSIKSNAAIEIKLKFMAKTILVSQ